MTKTRDLADLGGGFIQAGANTKQRTVESKLQDLVSVLDFIPQSEHAAIKARTSTYNATADIQKALDNGGRIYFPEGTYLIKGTLFVKYSGTVLVGAGLGNTIITADNTFVGSGESITNVMIQFNRFPSSTYTAQMAKLFNCGLEDLTISAGGTPPGSMNAAVTCLVHANWMHFFNIRKVSFENAYGNGTSGFGLILTAMGGTFASPVQEWTMFNTVVDSQFTYCVNGIAWGVTGQGDINAGQVYRTRFGGGSFGGTGIVVRSNSYANSFVDNDIEGFNTAFDLNAAVNYLRGNLAEQNAVDFTALGTGTGPTLVGNELNIVSSEAPGNHINEHGTLSRILVNSTLPSLVVDGNFNSRLYESAFLGTTLTASGSTESGRYVLNLPAGASITDRARLLVNTKGATLNGWYTFVVRAKSTNTGSGLYIKLPNGAHSDYQFAGIKTGTTNYLELLEANSHTFVANSTRSGYLTTGYKTYYGSVFFNNATVESNVITLSVQGSGHTVTVDYVGMFAGTTAGIPSDTMAWETYKDVSALTSGGSLGIVQLPYPVEVQGILTCVLDGNVQRSINASPYRLVNGGFIGTRVLWRDLNTFGYDAVGSTNTFDHIWDPGNSNLIYFSRSTLSGTRPLYFKLDLL